jgi:hypothetical protein
MKLSEAVAGYVGHKQAMGMRFHTEARILRSFCRASGEVTLPEISASQVLAFSPEPVRSPAFGSASIPPSAASIGCRSPRPYRPVTTATNRSSTAESFRSAYLFSRRTTSLTRRRRGQ